MTPEVLVLHVHQVAGSGDGLRVPPGHAAFAAAGEDTARYFSPSRKASHSMFDLNAYIAERAARAGIGAFEDLALDTYADEQQFFSYRRTTHRREPDYGRLMSVIVLN